MFFVSLSLKHSLHSHSSIHILTWNVSSKFPENLPVHKLLGLESKPENDSHRPDLYVIG